MRSSTTRWRRRALAGRSTNLPGSRWKGLASAAARLGQIRLAHRVTDARRHAQHDRGVVVLGDLERDADVLLGLGGGGGLEHGDLGRLASHRLSCSFCDECMPGIVGGHHHQARAHTHVGMAEEGIGGDVQPDVLHGQQRRARRRGSRPPPTRRRPSRWATTGRPRPGYWARLSRISVEGVPGYPEPKVTPHS